MGTVSKLQPGKAQFTELVQVSPKVAERYLEANTKNRAVSETTIEALAEEMKAGRWRLHHQGIAFDTEGVLRDGQHRLLSIVKSGVTVPMMVTTGIDPSVFDTIDAHRPRKVGDQLILFHGMPQGRRMAAAASIIHSIETDSVGGRRLPIGLVIEIHKRHKEGLDFATNAIMAGAFSKAPIIGALAYAFAKDGEKVAVFAKQLRDGERLTKNDPAYALRDLIIHNTGLSSNLDRRTAFTATIRCLHAFFEGERLSVVRKNQLLDSETYQRARRYFEKAQKRRSQ